MVSYLKKTNQNKTKNQQKKKKKYVTEIRISEMERKLRLHILTKSG